MKINDLNKIEEGLGSSLFGEVPVAALKGFFSGKGTKAQLTQDIFIKDFVGDAIASLDNGVQAGIIDPKSPDQATLGPEPAKPETQNDGATDDTATTNTPNQVNPAAVKPAPGQPGAAPAQSGTAAAVAAKKSQQQTTQNINNYVKQAAGAINQATDKNQKIALTKELVNSMADRKGTPEYNNAIKGVEGIIKRGGVDPGFASAAISNLRSGKTMSEAWRIYFANKLVEAVGLTWKDLGLCVLKEGKTYYIAETRYVKLNQLFESIMEVTTGGIGFGATPAGATATVGKAGTTPAPQNIGAPTNVSLNAPVVPQADEKPAEPKGPKTSQSISEYLLDWFTQYMGGVDWKAKGQMVLPLILQVQATYGRGKGKAALTKLAQAAFSLSKGALPKGIQDEVDKAKAGQQPAAAAPASPEVKKTVDSIQNDLATLEKTDPEAYAQVLAAMAEKAKKVQASPQPAAPEAKPEPTTTTESRRRK